ncbi:MAG: T9SS type A sorting domain-containing protein [Bacteroidota bacterium]
MEKGIYLLSILVNNGITIRKFQLTTTKINNMKKSIPFLIVLMLSITISKAQTAMQRTGVDCNGTSVDLYADLDAGKAVVLFFYMPNCGACPPPAQKIQLMANNINSEHPDMVKGYAFPFNNTTNCAGSITWASTSSVDHFFNPMDSGAAMVAYYGGFGMPTVVLLGGLDHRVMFSTLSFSTSDTTIMRDSLIALYSQLNTVQSLPSAVSSFNVFPNPAAEYAFININLKEPTDLFVEVTDVTGKQIVVIVNEKQSGLVRKQFDTKALANGNYFVQLRVGGKSFTQKLNVVH